MLKHLLVLCVLGLSLSATIVCTPLSVIAQKNVEITSISCTNVNGNANVLPRLPSGLTISNQGVISGKPTALQALTSHLITRQSNSGYIQIGVYDTPTEVTAGFKTMNVYIDLPIYPIKITGDSSLEIVTITPGLPSGLKLNSTTGIITGTYSGNEQTLVYTILGGNRFGSKAGTMTFDFQDKSKITSVGLVACYSITSNGNTLYPEEWFIINGSDLCTTVDALDLVDNYATTSEHTWAGLDSRFEEVFSAAITGYLNIGVEGDYEFQLTARNGAALYIDDMTTPLITFDGDSSSTRMKSGSINLSKKYHLIRLYYVHSAGEAILKLQYVSPSVGLPLTTIDKTVTFLGGSSPVRLTYLPVTSFNGGLLTPQRPTYFGGPIHSWLEPSGLPSGLSLSGFNGAIIGTTTVVGETTHTIQGTSVLGKVEGKVKITIKSTPVAGLAASFSKFRNQVVNQICMRSAFSGTDLNLRAVTVEKNLNHEELPMGGAWTGIPADVFFQFYVEWSGYLQIPVAGDYVFRLQNRDGSRVALDGNNIFSVWGCLSQMNVTETTVSLTAGHHSLFVTYFANMNSFGIILSWKVPGSNEFVVIPDDKYSYIPSSSFTYSTSRTIYYTSVAIASNNPVLYGITKTSSYVYTIDPELPAGLSISSTTGVISGTPTAIVDTTTFTITLSDGTTSYTTQIILSIVTVLPPENIVFTYNGQAVTEISVTQFTTISDISLSATNSVRTWSTEKALPEGMSLVQYTQVLSGRITSKPDVYTITIKAVNEGGSVTANLKITVTGCEYGNFFFTSLNSWVSSELTLKSSTGEVVLDKVAVASGLYSVVFCKPVGLYNYTISCSSQWADCSFRILRDDQMIFLSLLITRGTSATGQVDTVIKVAPTITAEPSSIIVAVRQPITVRVATTGIHHPITFTPALPSNLKWDATTNTLTGSFDKMDLYTYTIACSNEKGEATVVLSIEAGVCANQQNLITLSRANGRRQEYMKISKNGIMVLEVQFEDNAWSQTRCMENGDYEVLMKTTSAGGSWIAGNELLIIDTWEDLISSAMLDNGSSEQTAYFSISYVITDLGEIKYMNINDNGPKGWTTSDYNDNSWLRERADNFGEFVGTTVYFRRIFNVENRLKYPLFEFEFEIYDGVIAYINGKEVTRRNMPTDSTTITHQTLAPTQYTELLWRKTGVPTTILNNGNNVLAVELHKYAKAKDNKIKFDMYGTLLTGECLFRGDRGVPSGSDHNPDSRYTPSMAFDKDATTIWRDSYVPIWLQYTYNFDRYEYINKLAIRSSREYTRNHPKKFQLLGMSSISDNIGTVLLDVDDRNIFVMQYQTAEFTVTNPGTYAGYRLSIEAINSGTSDYGQVAEMLLYSCLYVYCPKAGSWPATLVGEKAIGNCPRKTFGQAVRSCHKVVFDPVWEAEDYTDCLSQKPPSGQGYIDFKYMVSNCTMENYAYRVNDRLKDSIRDLLSAPKDSVKLFRSHDCSDSETVNTCVFVRVSGPSAIIQYSFDQVDEMKKKMSYTMYLNPPQGFPTGMYFIIAIKPVLSTYQLIEPFVFGVLIVAFVIILITLWIIFSRRNSKTSKRRKREDKSEKESLV